MSGATGGAARAPGQGGQTTSGGMRAAVTLVAVLIVALVGMDALVLTLRNPTAVFTPHYYMALGDSLSFGFQPNLDFTSGFADDIFADLQKSNVTELANLACAGESTTTMISGNCPGHLIHHDAYTGAQLDAAIAFLKKHPGRVNPITIELGSNDVIPDLNEATCTPTASSDADLATMDANLTQTIFPRLLEALGPSLTSRPFDVLLLNYYNPFAISCPNSAPFTHTLNDHLAADAAKFRIPVVDVYKAFGGDDGMADHICGNAAKNIPAYTWKCDSQFHDIHPTTAGYRAIADAVEQVLGYPGVNPNGADPLPNLFPSTGWMSRVARYEDPS